MFDLVFLNKELKWQIHSTYLTYNEALAAKKQEQRKSQDPWNIIERKSDVIKH